MIARAFIQSGRAGKLVGELFAGERAVLHAKERDRDA
jgi:hypothetical protein